MCINDFTDIFSLLIASFFRLRWDERYPKETKKKCDVQKIKKLFYYEASNLSLHITVRRSLLLSSSGEIEISHLNQIKAIANESIALILHVSHTRGELKHVIRRKQTPEKRSKKKFFALRFLKEIMWSVDDDDWK